MAAPKASGGGYVAAPAGTKAARIANETAAVRAEAAPQPAAAAPTTAQPDPTQVQDNANGANATSQITATLNQMGLGGMAAWATSTAYQLAGQGIDPGDIINTITSQMNNPLNADGSVNQGALDAFNAALPGFNQRIAATGNNGSPGSSAAQAIANYINYGTQINQFSQQAGLLPGTITASDIGSLWAGNVSSAEVSDRITLATVNAHSAPQQVQDYLANNFGMTPGAVVSYYLNPTNTLATIQTNTNAGMAGGEANITGFTPNLGVAQAQAIGAFLANGSSGGSANQIGGVNSVSAAQANQFFTGNIGTNQGTGGSLGSLAQLGAYTQAAPGQANGTVDQNTLLAAAGVGGLGVTQEQALAATSAAQEARTAGSKGGGGATTTAEGAVGLGFAQG